MQVHISKLGESLDVDFDSLPESSRNYVIQYGLKQCLNDVHSAVKPADFDSPEAFLETVKGIVEDKVKALQSGEVTLRTSVNRAPVDPLERQIYELAAEMVKGGMKAKGITIKNAGKEQYAAWIESTIEKHRKALEKKAKELLAIKTDAPITLDLDAIGL